MRDLVSRLRRPILLLAIAFALLGAGGFALAAAPTAAPPVPTVPTLPTTPSPQTPTQQALALENRASEHVARTVAACNLRIQDPKPRLTISDGTPDPALLRVLGVLRRAPTREELHARPSHSFPEGVVTLFRRYTRIIHGPNGFLTRIAVGVGQQSVSALDRPACQRRVDATLLRLLRGQPHHVQHIALKFHRSLKLGARTRHAFPWLEYASAGGTGGAFNVQRFRTQGLMIAGGAVNPPPPGFDPRAPGAARQLTYHYEVNGLVPDDVARVTVEISGGTRRPSPGDAGGSPVTPYSASVTVHENAFGFHLPEDPIGAHMRLVWRDTAGHVIRTVPF